MKLKCETDEKGKPYNDQIRQVHYMFLNRRIGFQHIQPIIEGVLSLVDVQIEK
jgi:1-deoxy-D-xylulose 5-phosphate reductoisomerase